MDAVQNDTLVNLGTELAEKAIQNAQLKAQVKQLQQENAQLKKLVADKNTKTKKKKEGD